MENAIDVDVKLTGDEGEDQIAFGQCECGEYGQIFRTGKCAHCYVEELERATGVRCSDLGHVSVGIGDKGKIVCDECGKELNSSND